MVVVCVLFKNIQRERERERESACVCVYGGGKREQWVCRQEHHGAQEESEDNVGGVVLLLPSGQFGGANLGPQACEISTFAL